MTKFYYENSDEFYSSFAWKSERQVLKDNHSYLLAVDEANDLNVEAFFSRGKGDAKPILNQDYSFFAIPHELDDLFFLDSIDGDCLSTVLALANKYLTGPKYIASTDPKKCCVVATQELNEDVVWSLFSGHLNTPFLIFDINRLVFILIDFDLPLQIFGFKSNRISIDEIDFWREYVRKNWQSVVAQYSHYVMLNSIIRKYYSFIFDGRPS